MRARLATKKLKQLLSPAVQVALEIGVAPLQTAEPPPVEEPPLVELPALPPLPEPPAPPLLGVPPAVPCAPPLLGAAPAVPGTPALLVAPPVPVGAPPVLGAPAGDDAAPAEPPLVFEPESLPPQPVASSVTATQPLMRNAVRMLVVIDTLPSVVLMEFCRAF